MNLKLGNPIRKTSKSTFMIVFILFTVCFFSIAYLMPPEKGQTPPFFDNVHSKPLVIAHQGGKLLAPGNTIDAFQHAEDLGVDVIEMDIHITRDGHLVTIHDPTVNSTTDGKGAVADYTLKELQRLDAGYAFQDADGEYTYRGKGVYIPALEEVFQRFPHMKMNIEIKDDNPRERLDEITEKLMNLIEEYEMESNVLIASFDQTIIDRFKEQSEGRVAVQGGTEEVKKFVILHKLFMRNLYKPKVNSFQLPLQKDEVDLTDTRFIKGAQRLNIPIHYWTVNDQYTMKLLIKAGADGIITDRPDLLLKLLEKN
ncbi:glycerophosphodiester phosphodiesterase [Bacillus haikouensis]|jgi:glycerophosphoryl diester phosphodiesterase|uniref:glycerophosphodiester phosphodiesterase n=1 Tax=Bacillus haikouensis TaxID=1510468 RepID=UPI001551D37B|nr:glycerophosphodiester phosphodiesterase [Bacillus haikouensis]NQD67603.1 glycerophosphodiester phosphodiesterase [Bacillus haikouensis]